MKNILKYPTKLSVVLSVVVLFFLLGTEIFLSNRISNQTLPYEKVDCEITSITYEYVGGGTQMKKKYIVVVEYNGKSYTVGNLKSEVYKYMTAQKMHQPIALYYSNDKMYANMEGMNTDTPLAHLYFALMLPVVVMIWFTSSLIVVYSQNNKRG